MNNNIINITDFLKTGSYLGLKVGLPEKSIYSVFKKKQLGQKWYYDNEDESAGFSYHYDAIELMIIDSKIYSIGFDLNCMNEIKILDDILISQYHSFEMILNYLDIANINWSFEQKYCYSREITIKTEGGVLFGCVYDKGQYWLSKFKIF